MVYKFVLVSDEVDDFFREIQIDSEATFLDLHSAILKSVEYPDDQMTSFFMCEDNWENVELYKIIIQNKIDSVMKENEHKLHKISGKLIIDFIIDKKGKVNSCEINKSINNEIDSLLSNTICSLDFKSAAVYSFLGEPYSIRFLLPIRIDTIGHAVTPHTIRVCVDKINQNP